MGWENILTSDADSTLDGVMRGFASTGAKTLSYTNALAKTLGFDAPIDEKKLNSLQKKLEETKEKIINKSRTTERKTEISKLKDDYENADTTQKVAKSTLKILSDTLTHPKEWTIQGVVENFSPSDPLNLAGIGAGSFVAKKVMTPIGKVAAGASAGAVEGAFVGSAGEAANAYGKGDNEQDIKKAATTGAVGGLATGAVAGGVFAPSVKTTQSKSTENATKQHSKLFEKEEIHPDAIINVVKSAKKKEEIKPEVIPETKPAVVKEIVSDIVDARAESVGKSKEELLGEHPLEVREHKSDADVALGNEAKVDERVDSDHFVDVNEKVNYTTIDIGNGKMFTYDDKTIADDGALANSLFQAVKSKELSEDRTKMNSFFNENAEPMRKFGIDNIEEEFNANSFKDPLGKNVEVPLNLVMKNIGNGRESYLGMLRPTIEKPLMILQHNGADIYIKSFTDFNSVKKFAAVEFEGNSVSFHIIETGKIDNRIKQGNIKYIAPDARFSAGSIFDMNGLPRQDLNPKGDTETIPHPQQETQGAIKGMFEKVGSGGVIHIFENSDMTTVFHESAHWLESTFSQVEKDAFDMAFGKFEEGRSRSEAFAEGFVKWSATGEAPNTTIKGVFEKTREFLREVLSTLLNSKEAKFKLTAGQELFYRAVFGDEEAKAYLSRALEKREAKKSRISENEVLYQTEEAIKKGFNTPTLMPVYNFLSDFLRAQGKVGSVTKEALVKVHADKLYEFISRHMVYGGNRADAVIDAFSAYKIEQSARGNKSTDVYKHLEKLSKEDRAELHLVLSGDKEVSTLKSSLENTYKSLRNIIDQNAKELIELDELKIGDNIEHYLARTYQKDLKEANSIWNSITSSGGSVDHIKARRGKVATMWIDGSRAKEYEVGDSLTTKDGHTFEVENISHGADGKAKLTLHRDYTFAERGEMGETRDAAFSVWYTLQKQNAQIIRAKLLQKIPTKAFDDEEIANAAGYEKVPDEATADRFKLYGSLGGKYIRTADKADLDYYLNISSSSGLAAQTFGAWSAWTKGVTLVKLNDTVKNVSTHLNNFVSNIFVMSLRDPLAFATLGNPKKLMGAYKRIHELGLSDGEMLDIETSILKEFGDDAAKNTNVLLDMATRVVKELFLAKGTALGETARSLYRFEDAVFKAMVFARKRDEGFSDKQIIAYMRDSYVNYTKPLPPVVRNLDRGGVLPFASFTVRSAPVAFRAMAENPVKFGLFVAALSATGLKPDEKENELLPVWAKGSGNIFFMPKFLLWDSEDGKTIEGLNVGRWAIGMRSNPLETINAWTDPLAEDSTYEQKLGYVGSLIKIFTNSSPNDKKTLASRSLESYKEIAPNYAGKLVGDLMDAHDGKIDKYSQKAITKSEVLKDYLLGKDLTINKEIATKKLWEREERKLKKSIHDAAYGALDFDELVLEAKRVQKLAGIFGKEVSIDEENLRMLVRDKIEKEAARIIGSEEITDDEKGIKIAQLKKSYQNYK